MNESTWKFKTEDLIEILTQNKDKHQKIFEQAWKGYLLAVQDAAQKIYEQASHGKSFDRFIFVNLPVPESHIKDYDQVLRMLKLHQEVTVSLTMREFTSYVEDDWDWKREFVGTTSSYNA